MNKNIIITLAVVVVVVAAAFVFLGSEDATAPQEQNNGQNTEAEQENEQENEQVQGETYTISYTDEGYSPQNVTIGVGDTVVFENDSSGSAWPASNDHPVHNDYSEFDSRGPVAEGGSFSFTFEREGEWGYHDHLKPNFGGTITVQ